jgi:hypothetical protein
MNASLRFFTLKTKNERHVRMDKKRRDFEGKERAS